MTESPVTESHRRHAWDAFDRWSKVFRRKPLNEFTNEHRKVADFLETLVGEPPILRPDGPQPQYAMVPAVADHLRQSRPAAFKGIEYAIKAVRSELEQWATVGVPGAPPPRSGQPPPPRKPKPGSQFTHS